MGNTGTQDVSESGSTSRVIELFASDPNGADLTIGDGKVFWVCPETYNNHTISSFHTAVTQSSSSGVPTTQFANVTLGLDILSTKATIDVSETTSYTAAVQPVINESNNTITTGDLLRVDVDVAGTGTKGLIALFTLTPP